MGIGELYSEFTHDVLNRGAMRASTALQDHGVDVLGARVVRRSSLVWGLIREA